MENKIRVSVVIVNYKTLDLTKQAVDTLVKQCPWILVQGEIIIVDNASHDGSYEALKKVYPRYKVIESNENSGFAGGNNIGMKVAKGDYILLLNSDTVAIEDPLSSILNWMDDHKNVGIATIKLLNKDKSTQPTGGYFPLLQRVFFWMFFIDDLPVVGKLVKSFHPSASSFDKAKQFYDVTRQLDWVTGAFFLIRRQVIDKIGYFDEKMFMYTEETEYCYRAYMAGFLCCYVPIAEIIHLGGGSAVSKQGPLLGEYKNILYFYRKHMPSWQTFLVRIFLKIGALLRIIIFGIIGRDKEAKNIYVQAFRVA